MSLSTIFQFHGKKQNIRAVAEKSMPPPGWQLIFFLRGRRANENLNSVDGGFERNFNFIGGQ